jgi:tRNA pseudouridine32 synthase/23S rRNA pseudouridine746 synthase
MMKAQHFVIDVERRDCRIIDLLAERTHLPRQRLKEALTKGAVWLKRGGSEQRVRRATRVLFPGDRLTLHYDPQILALEAPAATLLADERDYSLWYKPAGLLAQGSEFGDHCALLRQAEVALAPRPAFLVHRLDREADGLMLIAHSTRAASALSQLWQQNLVRKIYRVMIDGIIGAAGEKGSIEQPLDGKPSRSDYTIEWVDETKGRSGLRIELITGRKHQIRRHCAGLGAPVVGDYRYGKGGEPLQLTAIQLQFRCPLTRRDRLYELPAEPRMAEQAG